MSQQRSLEAFLDAVGCPHEAGSRDSVVWVSGYMAGTSKVREIVDRDVSVEFDDENVIRFVPRGS